MSLHGRCVHAVAVPPISASSIFFQSTLSLRGVSTPTWLARDIRCFGSFFAGGWLAPWCSRVRGRRRLRLVLVRQSRFVACYQPTASLPCWGDRGRGRVRRFSSPRGALRSHAGGGADRLGHGSHAVFCAIAWRGGALSVTLFAGAMIAVSASSLPIAGAIRSDFEVHGLRRCAASGNER